MGGGGGEEAQPPPGSINEGSDLPCGVVGALRDLARNLLPFPFLSSEETKLRSRSAGGLFFRFPDEREEVLLAGFTSSTVKKEGGALQLLLRRFRLPLRPLLWMGAAFPATPPPRLLCCDRLRTLAAGGDSTQVLSAMAMRIRLPRPRPPGNSGSLEGDSQNLDPRRGKQILTDSMDMRHKGTYIVTVRLHMQRPTNHPYQSLPSSVSCHTMPSRLTLVPGWQGPRQAESPSRAPEADPSWVLVPTDLVLTTSCLEVEVCRAGGAKERAEGREDPGAPGWPRAGGSGTVNMGSTWKEKNNLI
ncbi:hypothetical protein EYF80_045538 [Liparis tanakae]|uniref:Uncharacterized protein n=1 Tax=Liparis tanakae TaxID=230148 RepID=A0A4Z2FTU7_9TELE|nr:hypothetical protein EYF80_045538 [Liparis tanakae]